MNKIDVKEMDTTALFNQYLAVVNRAIGENKDKTPYKQMMEAGEKLFGDKRIGAAIYKESTDTPHDWFTISMKDGKFKVLGHGKEDIDTTWKIKQSHLEKVVGEPEEFVMHPYKLDLHWLTSRIGLS